ncbi:MAG: hypothetical protein ACREP9_20890 [Candidatus Dormibacteraceae bacterium]
MTGADLSDRALEYLCGLKSGTVRVELRRSGELAVRFHEKYLVIRACEPAPKVTAPAHRAESRVARRIGPKSNWMQGFSDKPSPPTWKAIAISNATS